MVNEYQVLKDGDGEEKKLVGFARQKRLAIREKFTLFKDAQQKETLATSAARSIVDLGAVYDISDSNGKGLAAVKKQFKQSLINSTWSIYDSEMKTEIFTVREKSMPLALIRRVWELLPYAGEIPFFVKYHFVIKSGDEIAGEYVKITRLRDHYALYLEDAHKDKLDERAWMIFAVLLDAMQSR